MIEKEGIDSILARIDASMSKYKAQSVISQFNKPETAEVYMDKHLKNVVHAAFYYNRISKGQFDITIAPLVELWGFGITKQHTIPDSLAIAHTLDNVGMSHLKTSGRRLIKNKPGISIDVDGIAQGYSVDVLATYLEEKGVKNYLVELGGELRVKGNRKGKHDFLIGVVQPKDDGKGNVVQRAIALRKGGLTTAGNLEKFLLQNGKKLGHHIDPITGYPYESSIISVTVYASSAMRADALDNYLMGLDPDQIIKTSNKLKHTEVFIVYLDQGVIKEAYSPGFLKLIK